MKTVFTNSMVAHVWAQQSQESGRSNNGQFYFEGRALFSYGRHYVAAYALPRPNGAFVYLVNDDSYSITTARHVSYARYAVPGAIHCVGDLTELARILDSALNRWTYPTDSNGKTRPTPRRARMADRREALPAIKRHLESNWPGDNAATRILAAMGQRDAEAVAAAMGRKVERNATRAAEAKAKAAADSRASDARRMAATSPAEVESIIGNILTGHYDPESKLKEQSARLMAAGREARARGWNRVAEAVKARRAQVRAALRDLDARRRVARIRAEKRAAVAGLRQAIESARHAPAEARAASRAFQNLAESYATLNRVCGAMLPVATLGAIARDGQAARMAAEAKAAEAEAARHAAQAAYRAAWLNGSKERAPYSVGRLSCATGGALLRAVGVERDDSGMVTGGTLETSHGASVPLVHALRVFAFLKLCRARGQEWRRNGATLRVGHFQVDSVAANGDFVAGCHRITWAEVARLSESLGIAEAVAAADTTAGRAVA